MNPTIRVTLLSIFSVLNISVLLYTFISAITNNRISAFFLFLTIENFIWCTVYLTLVTIYELLGKFDNWFYLVLIRRIGKFLFTLCWTVVFTFWMYTLMGNDVMRFNTAPSSLFMHIYLHFIIGVFMFFELLTNKERHYVKGVFYHDLAIIVIIFIVYSSTLVAIAKAFELYIYSFLVKSVMNIIGYLSISVTNFIVSYLLYYSITRRFNKGVVHHNADEESNDESMEKAIERELI